MFALQHSVMARPGFKRLLTRICTGHDRAKYVCTGEQCGALASVLVMAAARGHDMERAKRVGKTNALCRICVWVGACLSVDFRYQSLRSLWTSTSLATPPGQIAGRCAIQNAISLPDCAPSSLPGFLVCLLEYSDYDGHASGIRAGDNGYILTAIQLEERDLMHEHPEYADYRKRVPMLVPGLPKVHGVESDRRLA